MVTFRYFWVLLDTFGYFWVLLGTFRYFWYFGVLLGTSKYVDYVTVNASYRAFWKTVMSTVGRDYAPRELHMDMETASSAAYMEVKKIYFLQKITSGI